MEVLTYSRVASTCSECIDVVRSATPTARARGHGEQWLVRGAPSHVVEERQGSSTCRRSGRERDARRFRRRACRRRGRHWGSAIRNAQSPGMTSAPPLYAELATRIPPYQCGAGRVVRLAGRRWSLTVRSSSSSRANSCSGTWSHRPASEELSSLVLARVGAQLRAREQRRHCKLVDDRARTTQPSRLLHNWLFRRGLAEHHADQVVRMVLPG